ncbi:class I SAM-dependent methyltransferase [Patescibacteria group bacterium]
MKKHDDIKHNIKAHDLVYDEYEAKHGEIFNEIEQGRLHNQLKQAIGEIKTASTRKEALDFGCGSGNLTKHLLDLGLHVTSADLSENFLKLIKEKFSSTGQSETIKINGQDLSNIEDNRFDFVATYSVLHHVPDYLKIVEEMARVTKPGGIIYLDHEANDAFWNPTDEYKEFVRQAEPKQEKKLSRFLKPSTWIIKFRETINPRYQVEGDIHVWPDDHIEWDKVEELLVKNGCETVIKEDYLLYKRGYPEKIYNDYKNKVTDVRVLVASKK